MPSQVRLDDINCLRLSRDSIQKWLGKPSFEQVIKGLFCRVIVRDKSAKKQYRIGRVETVEVDSSGKTATLTVAHGSLVRDFLLDFVSNGSFSEQEFEAWKTAMAEDGVPMLSQAEIDEKIREIRGFVSSATTAPKPQVGKKRDRAAAAAKQPKAKRARDDRETLLSKLRDVEKELLQERVKAEHQQSAIRAAMKDRSEAAQLLKEVTAQVASLGDQQKLMERKKKQAEEMQATLEDLRVDLIEKKGVCDERARQVKSEQEAVRLRLLKIKEMDLIIRTQEEVIEQQMAVAEAHKVLAASRAEGIEQLRAKNKQLSREGKASEAELKERTAADDQGK
eukprot:TRINITY_DN43895_c0_g1_i1.p1 TRINITY_DN43895_c0_g1~~TRINITY_DN43895_c0_g1_i1.p1  ORF type:complete len:354 (+),score=153.85 TRINITY_DN43895_c0_g1_i1:53-1063(+)